MARRVLLGVFVAMALATPGRGERLTLSAAASIEGVRPFVSDVRVFNRSYRETLAVEATYRCFLGSCPAQARTRTFSVGPRESIAFDDICARLFEAPGSAGAVEFQTAGEAPEGALLVASRLYATAPVGSVGMSVPGVGPAAARRRSVLTSIRNRGGGPAFRTNVGAFNTTDFAVSLVVRVFEGGVLVGSRSQTLGPRAGAQINDVFAAVGAPAIESSNAVVTVEASGEVLAYAAVIDEATTDPIFVLGAPDSPAPGVPSVTPSPNPSPTAPTPTPTPAGLTRTVYVGPGFQFTDALQGGNVSTIPVGTTIEWVWLGGGHSTTSGPCTPGCTPDGRWSSQVQTDGTFRFHFTVPGTYPYFCDPHSDQMFGSVVVLP